MRVFGDFLRFVARYTDNFTFASKKYLSASLVFISLVLYHTKKEITSTSMKIGKVRRNDILIAQWAYRSLLLESMLHLSKEIVRNKAVVINDKQSHVPLEYECRSSAVKVYV